MRQVRRSVFETNSSSSHSIVLTKKDHEITEKDLLTVNDDGLSCYRGIDLQEAEISLREFLLNEKYWVIVNGDACEEFYDLVKTGIINRDILEKNYWAYDPLEADFFHKEDVDADDDLCSFFDDVRQ